MCNTVDAVAPNADATRAIFGRVNHLAASAPFSWAASIGHRAMAASKHDRDSAPVKALRSIQAELSHLPPASDSSASGDAWHMRPLVMTMVKDNPSVRDSLRQQLEALPACDFSVYHFDCTDIAQPQYAAYAAASWYVQSRQIVRRAFVRGSGCQVEAIREVLQWLLHTSEEASSNIIRARPSSSYTHLWLLDNDMDFGLFSYDAFRALVSHRRPFVCQPAMLASKKGRRATDRLSLKAQFNTSWAGGRARCTDVKSKVPRDDVDNQPLIDAALFAPLYRAILPLDTRNQVAQANVVNMIAREFGRAAGPWPPPGFSPKLGELPHHVVLPNHRPAGLVFDWTPLIHTDTRLLGWGAMAYKTSGGTRCPRIRQGPPLDAAWAQTAEPELQRLRASWAAANASSLQECG